MYINNKKASYPGGFFIAINVVRIDVIFVVMDISTLYQIFLLHPSVQTDTRKLQPGDLFFALKGPSFNGNEYAQKALTLGAAYCIVDEPVETDQPEKMIRVDNVLDTLQQLAKKHRSQFDIPFIAITGSNGKTTTKELVHAVLSSSYKTYTTEGNLNNHIGVPLTLLKIKKDAEIAVIEMGANHQKEIASYCEYAMPTHGLITNCGKAHLEGFGGVEGVKKGKGELFDYLRAHTGTIFMNWDYDYLQTMGKGLTQIKYGSDPATSDVAGTIDQDSECLTVRFTKGVSIDLIHTQLVGGYNLPNVLAAVCIGKTFQVAEDKMKTALESYQPSNSRSQLIHLNNNTIVLDAYNANPSSMKVAIENFAKMPGDKKVLMLGGMMELGEDTLAEHQKIIQLIRQYPWMHVVLVGDAFKNLAEEYLHVDSALTAREWFHKAALQGVQVLIKGSRSYQMEKVLE